MAENKRKRLFRKDYLNDFTKDEAGRYAYSGEYITYTAGDKKWRKDIILIWICCAVPAVLLIVIGFMTGSGLSGNILIILPYALEMIAIFILIWKLVRLTYAGPKVRRYVHKSTMVQLPMYAAAAVVIAGIAIAGMIVSLIQKRFEGSIAGMIVYIAAQLALIAGSLLIIRILREMEWG